MSNNQIQAVLIDLDGCLVDMCDVHYHALNRALKQVANYIIPLEEHYARFNGLPTKEKLKKLVKENKINEKQIDVVYQLKQTYTISEIKNRITFDNDKVNILGYLKNRKYKLGCVTNSIRDTTELMLRQAGFYSYMNVVITNQDVDFPKPHPAPYLLAMQKLNVNCNQTLIVEDSEVGLMSAKSSGAHILKINGPKDLTIKLIQDTLSKYIIE